MKLKNILSILLAGALAVGMAMPMFALEQNGTNKDMIKMINAQRKIDGQSELKWDADLAAAAQQRAEELSKKYVTDHTRPDGSKFYTVSPLAWAENSAYGFKTINDAMAAFTKSKGHRDNMVDDRFTIAGIGCVVTSSSTYWVQLFGPGTSNGSWTKIDWEKQGYITAEKADSKIPDTALSKDGSTVDADGDVVPANIKADLNNAYMKITSGGVSLRIKNGKTLSPEAIKALNDTSAKVSRSVSINADTMTSTGKSVQGRLTFYPANLTARKTSLKLGVYVDTASISEVKNAMEAKYSNNMAYIHMDHKGSLGTTMKVSAKVRLGELDTDNLFFYSYNKKTDTLTPIEKPDESLDQKKYLTFSTNIGYDIVITDAPLKK